MAEMTWIGGTLSTASAYTTSISNSLAVAANWRSSTAPFAASSRIPNGSDNIWITGDSTHSILAHLTTLSTVTGALHVTSAYKFYIGSSTAGYMEMKPSTAYFNGRQYAYVDAKASTCVFNVTGTVSAASGSVGLRLKGTALNRLTVGGGTVGLAFEQGETSTVGNVHVSGGTLTLGAGATYTSATVSAGTLGVYKASATADIKQYGGLVYGLESWQCDDFTIYGGTAYLGGSGAVDSLTIEGGNVNTTISGQPRTYATVKQNGGTFAYDPDVLTITTRSAPDRAVKYQTSNAY